MKTKPKSILSLLCLLAASGCSVGVGSNKQFQRDPIYGLPNYNPDPDRISHYERRYDIFRKEFYYETVYKTSREQQIKSKIKFYDQCIAGEKPFNPYSSMTMIRGKPWLYEALPDHQIEWLIEQYHKRAKRHKRLRSEYISFANKLSELLKERKQKEIRTSSLQQLCESPDSDVNQVRSLLSLGCDVNAMNENGYPPLHLAVVTNKNVEFVTVLLEAGADVTTKCQGGKTALQHAAAENKNPEVFAALLEAGSDVNAKFDGGTAPLHSVVSFNPRVEIVRLLLKYGADVNAKDQQFGITPLHAASAFGTNPEVISVLLQAGANANLSNQAGQFPLDMARDNEVLQGTEALDKLTEATNQWLLLDSRLQRP